MALASSPHASIQAMPVRRTVYLVRHGEAMHNIEERHAKKRASEEAEGLGHSKGDEAHKAMCEAARVAVLENEEFRDASLSEAGIREAIICEEQLQKLAKTLGLKQPGEVLVSPLQRTLQTASAMFPKHEKVCVCELLRERRTGRPCDDSHPSTAQDPSFANMDWWSLMNPLTPLPEQGTVVEDVAMLRRRTGQLADVLHECSEETICIITHKGYLRELERGPLGRPAAAEFGNCEVRVYDVMLPSKGTMVASLRFCEGETPLELEPQCCSAVANTIDEVQIVSNLSGTMTSKGAATATTATTPTTATTNKRMHKTPAETKPMQYDLAFQIGEFPNSTEMSRKDFVTCF